MTASSTTLPDLRETIGGPRVRTTPIRVMRTLDLDEANAIITRWNHARANNKVRAITIEHGIHSANPRAHLLTADRQTYGPLWLGILGRTGTALLSPNQLFNAVLVTSWTDVDDVTHELVPSALRTFSSRGGSHISPAKAMAKIFSAAAKG